MEITAGPMPDPSQRLAEVVDELVAAAEVGFPSLWLPQLPAVAGLAGWDPLIALALAGQRAPAVRLGTAVSVMYGQHPFTLARQALTVSAATAGRLTIGLGLSHPAIVEAIGYSYDEPATFTAEYLDALLPVLRGEAVDVRGRFVTAGGVIEAPAAPPPSVVLAALGPRMLRIAGSRIDGTITTWVGPRTLGEHVVPTITKAAADAGRPAPRVIAGLPVVVTANADAVRARINEDFAAAGQMPSYRAVLDREGVDGPGDVSIVGDERHVLAQLRRLADSGVTEFTGIPHGDDGERKRTSEVLADAASIL